MDQVLQEIGSTWAIVLVYCPTYLLLQGTLIFFAFLMEVSVVINSFQGFGVYLDMFGLHHCFLLPSFANWWNAFVFFIFLIRVVFIAPVMILEALLCTLSKVAGKS